MHDKHSACLSDSNICIAMSLDIKLLTTGTRRAQTPLRP